MLFFSCENQERSISIEQVIYTTKSNKIQAIRKKGFNHLAWTDRLNTMMNKSKEISLQIQT